MRWLQLQAEFLHYTNYFSLDELPYVAIALDDSVMVPCICEWLFMYKNQQKRWAEYYIDPNTAQGIENLKNKLHG